MEALLPAGLSFLSAMLLVLASFFTSALTAAAGIGGGLVLLALMSYLLPPLAIVPVHGVVQMGSNAGRTVLQRKNIVWPTVFRFLIGAMVGASIGAAIAVRLPTGMLLVLLGLFILITVWSKLPAIPHDRPGIVVAGGAVTTFISMFVGATGPLSAVFLERLFPNRQHLVATHAAAMITQHGFKIVAFVLTGFLLTEWLSLLGAMIISGFFGTWFGTIILERLPEQTFRWIFKIVLTLVSLDMLRRGVAEIYFAA